ncbi:MAG: DUF393 domain-containing protein [Pseudomonadales bacterium]|uniref:Thiol-disulfide oxidoreductase DCC n=1 Tax=Oleiphilus messinensis TaxID=141451 RepID=A0A1Y0IGA1_9GAMM|nr:DCC1-like thiol-disulfide oxidoreductase family protein [Oleiphilus messinensis]ARU59280.1 thiol-disulfide oxidoreductase DCC [Oleiphilus messinensis]MCG8610040.1 DUF393 domain-containing protein [Pseudomonadales bacterium]
MSELTQTISEQTARAPIKVYFDGACPACRRDQKRYNHWTGHNRVYWVDITNADAQLREKGIDPQLALLMLHIELPDGTIVNDIEAYQILFAQVYWLKPLNMILRWHWLKEYIRGRYRAAVKRRLATDPRYCKLP